MGGSANQLLYSLGKRPHLGVVTGGRVVCGGDGDIRVVRRERGRVPEGQCVGFQGHVDSPTDLGWGSGVGGSVW